MQEYSNFGDLLRDLIKEAHMTQYDFYTTLGITKPYFYDILSGRSNPPPHEVQIKAMEILHAENETRKKFYDLAAFIRGDIPADISRWIDETPNALDNIRKVMLTKGDAT